MRKMKTDKERDTREVRKEGHTDKRMILQNVLYLSQISSSEAIITWLEYERTWL